MTTCVGTWKNVQNIKTISKEAGYTVLHELGKVEIKNGPDTIYKALRGNQGRWIVRYDPNYFK